MNMLRSNRFLCLLLLSSFPFNMLYASSPKGGVFNFAEIDTSGGSTDPLDMPLALPIANFFSYSRDGNKYSYTAKNSLPIAINIMYIESSLGHIPVPDSQYPPITEDNFYFSEHFIHYDADERNSWVSGGREGDWSLPIINAKPHNPGDAIPVITACYDSYETAKESRYKCRPASTASTQELSGYNNLINYSASKNKPLWVGSIVFPAASDRPEGDAKGSDRRVAAWTIKSDNGEHFTPYLDAYDDVMEPEFVSVGKDTLNNRTTESAYLSPAINVKVYVPEGQKGFALAQFSNMLGYPAPTQDNACICDTKGTQLFYNRLECYISKPSANAFSDFIVIENNITLKP
ncbi:hypothetical protein [Scandinavium goeteborgense]|uniref:hypothetical protein n=1 Tax=Scandinavium goeteborgense TaxID=1851514 RepID=UPI001FE30B95|nr:hypothetical protein [Scandinavium goeteborgense]